MDRTQKLNVVCADLLPEREIVLQDAVRVTLQDKRSIVPLLFRFVWLPGFVLPLLSLPPPFRSLAPPDPPFQSRCCFSLRSLALGRPLQPATSGGRESRGLTRVLSRRHDGTV